MSDTFHSIALVLVIATVTMALRFLPFLIFPEGKKLPRMLEYLGGVLPGAIMGMLVVYCFKSVSIVSPPHGIPELIASLIVASSYLLLKKSLISITLGTVIYMVLVQLVFV